MDTDGILGAGAHIEPNDDDEVAYLPLVDYEGKLLPVPFLMGSEVKNFFKMHVQENGISSSQGMLDSFTYRVVLYILHRWYLFKIMLFYISKYLRLPSMIPSILFLTKTYS